MNFKDYLQRSIAINGLANNKFGALTLSNANDSKLQNLSLFSSASLEDLKGLNWTEILAKAATAEASGDKTLVKDGKIAVNSEEIAAALTELEANGEEIAVNPDVVINSEMQALTDIVKELMNVDGIQNYADADGNGTISEEEALGFVQSIMGKDGDDTSLTYEDIDKAFVEYGIDLEQNINKLMVDILGDNEFGVEEVKESEAAETPSSSSAGGGYGGYGYGSGSRSSSQEVETPEKVQAQIDEKRAEIDEINSQAEKDIQVQEEAKKNAMRQAGVSEQAYQQYQRQEEALLNNIAQTEQAISEKDDKLSDNNATISSNENYIASIESQIRDNQTIRDALDTDNEKAQERKNEINTKIANLETEKARVEKENQRIEQENQKIEEEKNTLNSQKQQYETQRQELLTNTLNSSGFGNGVPSSVSEILRNNIREFEANIDAIRRKRDIDVNAVKEEISVLEVKLKDLESQDERNSFLKDNRAISMQDAMDLGLELDGKSASEMRAIMTSAGYAFYDKAWCGLFQEYIIGETIGLENTADWYQNCNRASCPSMYYAAQEAGAFVDPGDAQPGDLLILQRDGNGHPYHVAMIVSINDDGSYNTIEGNTSDDSGNYTNGVVNERHRSASSGTVVRVSA